MTALEIAGSLSEAAKADLIAGNCTKGSDTCVCCSDMAVKGEFAQHRLAEFPANPDRGCLLTPAGLEVRSLLKDNSDANG
jgi:hypothetical protein